MEVIIGWKHVTVNTVNGSQNMGYNKRSDNRIYT